MPLSERPYSQPRADQEKAKTKIPGYLNSSSSNLERFILEPEGGIKKKDALAWMKSAKLKINEIVAKNYDVEFPDKKGYGPESLEADGKYVEELKRKFDKENAERLNPEERIEQQQISDLWETILYFNISKWLGNEVESFPGSDYDDIVNKVDDILALKNTDELLSIDAATGHDLQSKVDYVTALYQTQRRLNFVKYHLGKNGEIKFRKAPHLILGLSKNKISEITTEWMKTGDIAPKYQKAVLLEMHMQLKGYADYFENSLNEPATAEQFKNFIPIVEKALQNLPEDTPVPVDETYKEILKFTSTHFPSSGQSEINYAVTEQASSKENGAAEVKIPKHPTRSVKVIKKAPENPEQASSTTT